MSTGKSDAISQSPNRSARQESALPDVRKNTYAALEEACSFVSASMCILLLYEEGAENKEEPKLKLFYTVGMPLRRALEFERAANQPSTANYLNRLSIPVVSDASVTRGITAIHDWASTLRVSSYALVPLASGVGNRGMIVFCTASDRLFDVEDTDTLRFVGQMVALVLATSHQKSKDRFMNALSHELRTPLTSIIGFTQIIRKRINNSGERDERLINQVDVLWSQAQRLSRLIDTFVDVSRLESGEFSISPDRVEIVALLKKSAEHSLAQARSKHRIDFELPDDEIAILADAKRLDMVFSQIVSNAIRYSPENEPIKVRCDDVPDENKVIVSITDRGPGVPASRITDIFQRFATTEPLRAGGLGVGLFVSKSIVEAHGGIMSLESFPVQGTIVRIELPK